MIGRGEAGELFADLVGAHRGEPGCVTDREVDATVEEASAALGEVGARRVVVFDALQQRDLGSHERAVGDVVVGERRAVGLTRGLRVVVEERRGQVGAAVVLEIHREEADVEQDVAPPQRAVELEAVEDARPIAETEHVLGDQVAITVEDPPVADALLEQLGPAGEVVVGEFTDLGELVGDGDPTDVHRHLVEVALPRWRSASGVPAAEMSGRRGEFA